MTKKKKGAAVKRTDSDRLRSLLAVTTARPEERFYTQKELAAELGISTRTLRRIKNIPGYEPAQKTLERIHAPLVREESRVRRKIVKRFNLPKTKAFALPHIYPSKAKPERTLELDVTAWTADQKTDFLLKAHAANDYALAAALVAQTGDADDYERALRYRAWRAKVRLPLGIGESGAYEFDEDDPESQTHHYMTIGPFAFIPVNRSLVAWQIKENSDAGREVEQIFLIENLEPKKPRKKGKRK